MKNRPTIWTETVLDWLGWVGLCGLFLGRVQYVVLAYLVAKVTHRMLNVKPVATMI